MATGYTFLDMDDDLSSKTTSIDLTTSDNSNPEVTNITDKDGNSASVNITDAKFTSGGILESGKLDDYTLTKDGDVYDTSFNKVGTWSAVKGAVSLELDGASAGNGTGTITVKWQGVYNSISALDIGNKAGIDSALTLVSTQQADVGAGITALSYASDHLANMTSTMDNAYTAITEADMAEEMTKYVKSNIYAQAAQAMIAQANQSMAQVLNLLQ